MKMRHRLILVAVLVVLAFLLMYKIVQLNRPEDGSSRSIPENESELLMVSKSNFIKTSTPLLRIKVFYEVLCPDSKYFIVKQLYPTWLKLKSTNSTHLIQIHLIPWGKATASIRSGNYMFNCQHGEEECKLNRIHSCLLDNETILFETKLEMIKCSISNPAQTSSCGLLDCSNGDQLLYANGQLTNSDLGNIDFVPTITVNESRDNQNELLKNFYGEIIQRLKTLA